MKKIFGDPRKIDWRHFAGSTSKSDPEKDILYKALWSKM